MASLLSGTRIDAHLAADEHILPRPFRCGIWVFPGKSVGEEYRPEAVRAVPLEHRPAIGEVALQWDDDLVGQRDDPILGSLAVAYKDSAMLKVQILDPQ